MKQKWENKVCMYETPQQYEAGTNELGDDGWEVCGFGIEPEKGEILVALKRERIGTDAFVPLDLHNQAAKRELGLVLRAYRKKVTQKVGLPAWEFCNDKELWRIVRDQPDNRRNLSALVSNADRLIHARANEVLFFIRAMKNWQSGDPLPLLTDKDRPQEPAAPTGVPGEDGSDVPF